MRIDIVTLFPELCDSFLSASILGRARAKNLFEAHCHQIRDYTKNKQKQTDDYPYGGGCGMVLYAQPIADCLRAVQAQCAGQGRQKPHVVFLTAAGRPYTEEKARESFGFLMDAYKFGAPPHGGMAYGLDRMVMLMLKKDSIRDVIAFPKVHNAGEPLSGAPDVVDEQQLKDLSIALTLKD